MRDPLGFEQQFEIERIWLLVILDVFTRAVLGYHVSLNREYSRYDVIRTIEAALEPHRPRSFTLPGLGYGALGGCPSDRLPIIAAGRSGPAPDRDRRLSDCHPRDPGLLGLGQPVPALSDHWRTDLWSVAHWQDAGDRIPTPYDGADAAQDHDLSRPGRAQAAPRRRAVPG